MTSQRVIECPALALYAYCPLLRTMANKVLVTGASGLLGREVFKRFVEEKWDTFGLAYSRVHGDLHKVNLCDEKEVEAVLERFKPQVVIHAAAERRPDVVANQAEAAVALNVTATQSLVKLCSMRNIYLLYISTDYVFDGKDPPYSPSAATNPLNAYGTTKRDGENVVLQNPKFGVLRVPVLYGPVEYLGESAVTTLFSSVMDSKKSVKMSDYEQRYPTHVINCAQVCVGLAKEHVRSNSASGIWHFSGEEVFTKYAMSLAMADLFGLGSDHLAPVKEASAGATRPYDCHLDSSATTKIVPITYIPFSEGIKKVLEPFCQA